MNRKYKLTLISLVLLFLGSFSSVSAATCGRVDSNGDYWYQCDGVQITQLAQTMLGDIITNFTNSDADASWNFYDGLNNATTSYLSTLPSNGQRVSLTANPSTVDYNGSSTLSWSSTNVISCSAPWTANRSTAGSEVLSSLTSTQDYSIQCKNKGMSRWNHSSVLYNGKIYSWGGRAGEMPDFGTILNTLDIYDIATNSWSTGATGGAAREDHSSVLYNGKIYFLGGGNGGTLNTVDIYDIASNSWSTGRAGGTIRRDHTSVLYNGKIYSWGGWDLHMGSYVNTLNTLDIYDIASNSWSTGRAGGSVRYGHSSVLYNGKIYSWGGFDRGNTLNTLDIYNIANNSWSTGRAGGTARQLHTAALYNGKIYFWGGYGVNGVLNIVDIYDIATNSWSTGAAGGAARLNHSSVLYGDKMYSFWGSNGSPLNTLDVYNITSNLWIPTSNPATTVSVTTKITVNPQHIPQPPTVSINSSDPVANIGDKTLLTWSSTNANSCYAIGGWGKGLGTLPSSGSTTTSPIILGMNYFPISCTGSDGTAYATSTVEGKSYPVTPPACPDGQTLVGEYVNNPIWVEGGHYEIISVNNPFYIEDWQDLGYWQEDWQDMGYWQEDWQDMGYWQEDWQDMGYWQEDWQDLGYWQEDWQDMGGDVCTPQPDYCFTDYGGGSTNNVTDGDYDGGGPVEVCVPQDDVCEWVADWQDVGYWVEDWQDVGYWVEDWQDMGYWVEDWQDLGWWVEDWQDLGWWVEDWQDMGYWQDDWQDVTGDWVDESGYVDNYEWVESCVPDGLILYAPTGLSVLSGSCDSVKLSWVDNQNAVGTIDYILQRNTSDNFSTSSKNYSDTGPFELNTRYYYKVMACEKDNYANCSGFSNQVSVIPCSGSSNPVGCVASQGDPPDYKNIFVNRSTLWKINIDSITPGYSSIVTKWSGTDLPAVGVDKNSDRYEKIYTTVGLKKIIATTTAIYSNGNREVVTCSTSTNVMRGDEDIKEI